MSEYDDNLYCTVFVQTELPRHEVERLAANATGAQISARGDVTHIEGFGFDLDVRRNEDFGRTDDFVGWRYRIEIGATKGQPRAVQVAVVSRLLTELWTQGLRAVAACDFEEDLPRHGGYNPDMPRI